VASKRIQALAADCGAELEWFPVVLGGLYGGTKAPQGKDGSASDVMAPNKQLMTQQDLFREAKRWGVDLQWNSRHPMKSVKALRLIASLPNAKRGALANALFDEYWTRQGDVLDDQRLAALARQHGGMDDASLANAFADKDTLFKNTEWAIGQGVFGVPSFFVTEAGRMDERFYFGQDRTIFLAQRLRAASRFAKPLRILMDTPQAEGKVPTLEWFHDFSSPWSYLSSLQVETIAKQHHASECLH
jgi:2-hydroxychromene-2-carboxylate isomerase